MTNRRYEVVEWVEWQCLIPERCGVGIHFEPRQLDSIPDDLVEEAARVLWHLGVGVGSESRRLARAALGVLFEEEE